MNWRSFTKKLENYFTTEFNIRRSTNGWYRFSNPFDLTHDDISMGVNFDSHYVRDFRTGYAETITTFLMSYMQCDFDTMVKRVSRYNGLELPEFTKRVKRTVRRSTQFKPLLEGNGLIAQRARKYIQDLNFDLPSIAAKNFQYCDDESSRFFARLIVPFMSQGDMQYFIARSLINASPKYLNPTREEVNGTTKSQIFYNERALNLYDDVILVEGWSDAERCGDNAIASLGWSLSEEQKYKIISSQIRTLTIIPDRGWFKQALLLAMDFTEHKNIRVVQLEYTDMIKDPCDHTHQTIQEALSSTDIVTRNELIDMYYA